MTPDADTVAAALAPRTVMVELGARRYPIVIENGLLARRQPR